MKKWSVYICLPVLLALACLQTGFHSIHCNNTTTSYSVNSDASFNSNLNYPDSEIERGSIYHYTANAFTGLQKTVAHLPGNTKILISIPRSYSLAGFSHIELFDNNRLSHNYPAHNFW